MKAKKNYSITTTQTVDYQIKRLRQLEGIDVQAMVKSLFQTYDKNSNGYISLLEFQGLLHQVIKTLGGEAPAKQDIQDIFNHLDLNGDEQIDIYQMKMLITKLSEILLGAGISISSSLRQY